MWRKKNVRDEGFDVAAVDVRVTHDDHLVVAKLGHVEGALVFLGAHRDAERGVDVLDLFVLEDLVVHGLFHVEDFTPQWKDGLEQAVAALLGRTSSRVTLNEEHFAQGGVLF